MATVNLQVAATNDDATDKYIYPNWVWENIYYLYARKSDGTRRYTGQRWSATLPQGCVIDSATMQIYVYSTSTDDADVDICGEDVDSAPAYNSGLHLTSRTKTSASVTWTQTGLGIGWKTSPELKTIIQELVDRPGWSSGNYIGLMFFGRSGYSLRYYSFDQAGNEHGPKLDITYHTSSVGADNIPPAPQIMMKRSRWHDVMKGYRKLLIPCI